MTYDATTGLLLPIDAKVRWAKQLLAGGDLPSYSAARLADLPVSEKRLARRQWIVFGTGPYADARAAGTVS